MEITCQINSKIIQDLNDKFKNLENKLQDTVKSSIENLKQEQEKRECSIQDLKKKEERFDEFVRQIEMLCQNFIEKKNQSVTTVDVDKFEKLIQVLRESVEKLTSLIECKETHKTKETN